MDADDDASPHLRVEVLGPLRLAVDGRAVDPPGPRRRAVLALLALAEGRTVTVDALAGALWPDEPPGTARATVQTHVSRVRRLLGPAASRLETRPDGYRLAVGPRELDLARVRTLLRAARTAEPAEAYRLLREAYGLWRGPVLADLADLEPVAVAVEECRRLRQQVADALVDAALAAGRVDDDVLTVATRSLADDPFREPAVLRLVRVRAALGHAVEGLDVARRFRERLAEETGLDPSPALADTEREVAAGAGPGAAPVGAPAVHGTRLVGREGDVAALHRALAGERLVTVVGPGGVGKTRLAVEVARRSTTAHVARLAPVDDPAAVPHALAAALGLRVERGDVLDACAALLGDAHRLLVLDNAEHLLDGVRDATARVLAACPHVVVLVTSREPLGLAAEYTYRLSPLPVPSPDGTRVDVASVVLFLERARRVRPDVVGADAAGLRLVGDVVRRLDGMPLAIELAAGRLSTFALADLRDRLDRSLDLLGGATPSGDPRHRTLRATLAWSYDLLDAEEQRLLRALAVFVDGVDLATAEALAAEVCPGADPGRLLARLVDASMVVVDFTGGTRYRMLATLRAFAADRLAAAGETAAAEDRLVRWAVSLCARLEEDLQSEREPEADAVLRRELANLRAAWRTARTRAAVDDAARIVCGLSDAVTYRDVMELREWALELAEDPGLTASPLAAAVLGTAAEAAYHRGERDLTEALARRGADLAPDAASRFRCLTSLTVARLAAGAFDEVVELARQCVALEPRPRESRGLAALATLYAGDPEGARAWHGRGSHDHPAPSERAWAHYVDGEIANLSGGYAEAEEHYLAAIDLAREAGTTFLVGIAAVGLVTARARDGRVADALRGYREVVDGFARTGNWTHLWTTLRNLADLLREQGDEDAADLIHRAADVAPDAPAVGPDAAPTGPPAHGPGAVDRARVLDVARAAINRALGGS